MENHRHLDVSDDEALLEISVEETTVQSLRDVNGSTNPKIKITANYTSDENCDSSAIDEYERVEDDAEPGDYDHLASCDMSKKHSSYLKLFNNTDAYTAATMDSGYATQSEIDAVVLMPGPGQYDDYTTIDWQREMARDRMRHRFIARAQGLSYADMIKGAHDAWSGWLCVLIIGVVAGFVAGTIDIGTSWMVDLKDGVCPQAFWLNRKMCCWSANDTMQEGGDCSYWLTWTEVITWHSTNQQRHLIEYSMFVVVSLCFSMLAVILVRTFAPYAVGGGIPEIKTILSGFVLHGHLGKWTLLLKSIGVMLSVSAGLSLGKEGPLVHVACCVGNIVANLFPKYARNEAKKREILSAAAASGVSVAFGSPIGGVLFSLEEVSYYFPLKTLWRSFFCAMVAAFVLQSINPFGNQHMIVFFLDYNTPWGIFELVPIIMVGAIGGVIGCLFIKGNVFWCKLRKKSFIGKFPVLEVFVITVITAIASFPNPFTRLDTAELIALLVKQCGPEDGAVPSLCAYDRKILDVHKMPARAALTPEGYHALGLLMVALVFKVVMLIVTIGVKLPAGLYIPSLAIGAIMGRIIGMGVEQIAYHYSDWIIFKGECGDQCITPGLYALVGAAAVLAGVTRMTVALVVIMFEVTGGVRYIVPLMAAVMTSKWVADAICKKGIYEFMIDINGYPFLDSKDEFTHTTLAIDAMQPKRNNGPLAVITQDTMTIRDINNLLRDHSYNGFPVVLSETSCYLVGYVLRRDLKLAIANSIKNRRGVTEDSRVCFGESVPRAHVSSPKNIRLRNIVDLAPITVTQETPMETVIDIFKKLGLRQTLVIHNGKLMGIITKKDVLKHIRHVEDLHKIA